MASEACSACGGSGTITRQRTGGEGTISDECRACSGTGKVHTGGDGGWS